MKKFKAWTPYTSISLVWFSFFLLFLQKSVDVSIFSLFLFVFTSCCTNFDISQWAVREIISFRSFSSKFSTSWKSVVFEKVTWNLSLAFWSSVNLQVTLHKYKISLFSASRLLFYKIFNRKSCSSVSVSPTKLGSSRGSEILKYHES